MGLADAFRRQDGTRDEAGADSPWDAWVAASKTYNFCSDDPLIDWLELYGTAKGYLPDNVRASYDERTDFRRFLTARAVEFERAVVRWFADVCDVARIPRGPGSTRSRAAVEATWEAIAAGSEMVVQGVLWNPDTRTHGAADLLVRSDILHRLFPGDISAEDASQPARHLDIGPAHYRVVEIKFTTLDLLKDGHAGSHHIEHMVQVWLYNEALGRMQGYTPQSAHILGRKWKSARERGASAFDRLARVDRDRVLKGAGNVGTFALAACDWVRRLRGKGASWDVLPRPSVEELWPNLRRIDDQPWHGVKREIAHRLEDLTLLPRVTPDKRAEAIRGGLTRWTDRSCTAERLGISGDRATAILDAVIRANHSGADGPIVFPDRITANEPLWREPAVAEFYVDFETVSDLDDDFARFPETNSEPLIFMIGCGHHVGPMAAPQWTFGVFTAEELSLTEERRILGDWFAYMEGVCERAGTTLANARLFHWSPAETSTLTDAYNAAHVRQGSPAWPALSWCDLLNRIVRKQPVTVRGAFGFGLKAIAKAMHAGSLIQTSWGDGPTDGLGAMVGAWHCNREARRLGVPMTQLDLMRDISAYNEVDCRVMAEVLHYFRTNR